MCGRYTLTSPLESVQELFDFPERPNLEPRSNIAPTQEVPAIRHGQDGAQHLVMLRWGLIPAWAKDAKIASRLINARSETVGEKPSFRQAFAKRRCLVPADGYYEWRTSNGDKQPFRVVSRDGGIFAFAGLWEQWSDPACNNLVETCSLLTTQANRELAAIHHRMPVILPPSSYSSWLDPAIEGGHLRALLQPMPLGALRFYPVSDRVNKVVNQGLDLLDEINEGALDRPVQGQLF
ncbi:MAG: SOS response-associated peptidase [Pseudomonadota bacterium]